jgi:hypothetical protein
MFASQMSKAATYVQSVVTRRGCQAGLAIQKVSKASHTIGTTSHRHRCIITPAELFRPHDMFGRPGARSKTRKLWKHSAMRLAVSRTSAAHQFTNRLLMNSVCPPRCPLHSPGLTCMRTCTSPRAGAASTIEIANNI